MADTFHRGPPPPPRARSRRAVRAGELSARDLVEASLRRIDELQPGAQRVRRRLPRRGARRGGGHPPRRRAAVRGRADRGQEQPRDRGPAADVRRRLHGRLAPRRTTTTSSRRLRAAGFVVVGSTTLPEWGILPWTNTKRFGPTRNPWDPARTSGGSSGGSAAAVAAGMVPIAHANDGGGSTRIPAACCGLVGLKPQRNRISLAPEIGQSFLAIDGVLTHTIADTAAALDVLAGPEVGDAAWAPPPAEPFAASAGRPPGRLRVAVTRRPPLDVPVEPQRAAAAREAGALLASLGHEVEEADPPWRQPHARRPLRRAVRPARDAPGRPGADDRAAASPARGRHGAAELRPVGARLRRCPASTRISPPRSSRSSPAACSAGWTPTTSS